MQQLTKSLGSFTWAMSLFGVQQATAALSSTSGNSSSGKAIDAFDDVTRASLEHLGATTRQAFEMGDKLQRGMIDTMFRFIPMQQGESASGSCDESCSGAMDIFTNPMEAMRRATGMGGATEPGTESSAPPEEQQSGWGPIPPGG